MRLCRYAQGGESKRAGERTSEQCNFGWGIAIPLEVRKHRWARKSTARDLNVVVDVDVALAISQVFS